MESPPLPLLSFISLAFSLFHSDACGDVNSGHSYFPSLGYDIESYRHRLFMLPLRNVWADLGTRSPSGQHFVVAESVWLLLTD